MPEIFSIAEQVTVTRDGRIVPSERTAETTGDAVIATTTGKAPERLVKPHKGIEGGVLLSIADPSKPGAVDDAGFELRRGVIAALTGLRGCGIRCCPTGSTKE